jgi:putative methionine-R-sulfoxide reductase with GAF domain
MNSQSTLDRETFQRLLASAFAVQESQIDRESLSAILAVQRSVASGKLDLGGAMHSVVESARTVANASGVAIGLLRGHQLTYQAGSGTSAACVGQHVTASLTVSATPKSGREILRVENAQADNRIEADICRQFGASALLILPIYHERAVAGVLDIRFGEPHSFQDREVRTYQLMAEQIEAAISQSAQLEQKNQLAADLPIPLEVPLLPEALDDQLPDAPRFWMGESSVPSLFERCAERYASALATVRKLPAFKQSATFAITILQRAKKHAPKRATGLTGPSRLRNAALGSAAVALAIAGWIVYTGHRPASSLESSTLPKSTAVDPSENLAKHPARAGDRPELVAGKGVRRARIVRKRVRIGDSDVEYFGDDVTVRWFTARTAKQRTRVAKSRVTHIGDDVTVRYFSQPQPAVVPVSQ